LKQINSKQVIPLITICISILFIYLGLTTYGFWSSDDGPMPGFFPVIMSVVLILTSAIEVYSSRHESKATYFKDDFLIVIGTGLLIMTSYIIGLIPSVFLFVIAWLKIVEKESWRVSLTISIGVLIAVTGVFVIWLGVPFPRGIIGNLIWGWIG